MSLIFRVESVAEIGSTNDALKQRAAEGGDAGLVLRADRQLSGRGRRGRSWTSEPGNLYVSILLRPRKPAAEAATLGFVAALAIGNLVRALVAQPVTLKWPNDVLVGGAKISGILLESGGPEPTRPDWLVLGMGVNLRHHPAGALYPTTDLVAAGGPALPPDRALDLLLAEFQPLYQRWQDDGFAALREEWLRHAQGLGARILARLGGEEAAGTFAGIEPDGTLLLETETGVIRRIAAGDIFFAPA
ncbi:BirA family biotin operon repressor/biotin-[acetyl-CoA-carboxylase] ligase [Dongia mobilis]|uniref:biotin--[biotin carboxyl-carrier protein] ligase n=1 Tax=Dongia mobilis TaxID=578943 RepID=A0A4R6WPV4_9PROT|nr:biotin--[acetyl-CoA-carboxylase] ligase [Dongia mobilis]TDQ80537.1 BirA family biotin operon repressor/biotin-[acetyl-CoA-carboxylase] ligase [Dongia mobilis]